MHSPAHEVLEAQEEAITLPGPPPDKASSSARRLVITLFNTCLAGCSSATIDGYRLILLKNSPSISEYVAQKEATSQIAPGSKIAASAMLEKSPSECFRPRQVSFSTLSAASSRSTQGGNDYQWLKQQLDETSSEFRSKARHGR